jgi:dTMP kinase
MAGLFITVEGIDGAGKTTHLEWLRKYFEARQRVVVVTREPGGTPVGEVLRTLLLKSDHPIHPETEALLVFAARREHLERVILPALSEGKVVICDRFTDATFAYQGWGRGVGLERLEILEEWVQGGLQPDLTLFFDVPVAVGQQRLGHDRERDRFERERAEFFERVRTGYLDRARRFPARVHVVDSTPAVDKVRKSIEKIVSRY